MKKVFVVLLVVVGLLAVPNVSLAANWVYLGDDGGYRTYLDIDSIKVIKNGPPVYAIQGKVRSYRNGSTMELLQKYFYDSRTKEIAYQMARVYVATKGEEGAYRSSAIVEVPRGSGSEAEANEFFYRVYHKRFR